MKRYIWFLVFAMAFASSCKEDKVEVKETSDPVESLITSIAEIYSTYDIVDDLISSEAVFLKKNELIIPNSVILTFSDYTFDDGDGIAFTLDFGDLGANAPHGVLCKDNKYRAGIIQVSISDKYSSSESQVIITMPENKPFYSGDGSSMNMLQGIVSLSKIASENFIISTTDFKVKIGSAQPVEITCNNIITKTKDAGLGIINDEVEIDGSFKVKTQTGSILQALVVESLRKNYESNCVKNIVSGLLELEGYNSASEVSVDFDPNGDGACDNLVKITINDKSTLFQY